MTKITINLKTFRDSVAQIDADLAAFDESSGRVIAAIGDNAKNAGFDLEIDTAGHGPNSYSVRNESSYADLEAAHEFIQSPAADFWAIY